jgi:protein SCO1
MKVRAFFNAAFIALAVCSGGALAQFAAPALPAESIYQLPVTLKDQDGRAVPLASLRGQVQIVTMFYTQCSYACPLTIDTMKALQSQLNATQRQDLHMLLISLDPERDAVPALKKAMQQRDLDAAHWTMTRAEPQDVRKIAAVLGVQYRKLLDAEFNHSSILTLLDAQGRIRAKTSKVGEVDQTFLAAVKNVLNESAATIKPDKPDKRGSASRAIGS